MITTPFPDPPAPGTATQVAPGVLWMRLPLPMALNHVNVYALDEGSGWTVIDTGFDTRASRDQWAQLLAGPLAGRPVTRVIVTHYHPDHIGLAGWFAEQGAELWMTDTTWLTARMLVLDKETRPSPLAMAFYHRAGMPPDEQARRADARPFNFADCVAPLTGSYRQIREGDVLTFGGRRWDLRLGQGHAPDHATFWSRDDALVLGGDQLLLSISPNLSVYPQTPEADPVGDWIAACARFQPHATPDQLILGGHKLPYTGLPHRLEQMIENHHAALRRLIAHLEQPCCAAECFDPLFKRRITRSTYGMALGESVAHLNHLHQTGQARRWLDDTGIYRYQAFTPS